MSARPHRVAAPSPRVIVIVGAGPRGCSLVERLIANADLAAEAPVRVELIDPAPIGGRIWRSDQPGHLLMNTLCHEATHFTDPTVDCLGPIVEGPTLYEWCRRIAADSQAPPGPAGDVGERSTTLDDPELVRFAAAMRPHSHPPRRLLGAYLEWCFAEDLARAPDHVEIVVRRRRVVTCEPEPERVSVRLDDGTELSADVVILAGGHADAPDSPAFAARGGQPAAGPRRVPAAGEPRDDHRWYGRPANPVDLDLSALAPGQPVIVRGLGMNFFDYVSILTEGRGGRFVEVDPDAGFAAGLRYRPGGAEPVLLIGSGRGTPYRAKPMLGTMTPRLSHRFLTPELVAELAERGSVDFMVDLWPAVVKDTLAVYYETLSRTRPEVFDGDHELIRKALLTYDHDSDDLAETIASVVSDPAERADLATWDRPLRRRTFAGPEDFTTWWLADLWCDLGEAALGFDSAYKLASLMLGQGRTSVRALASYGGLRGRSYDADVDRWFKGFAGSLASGPPARRIAELIALTEAGVVRPIGPGLIVGETDDGFSAVSPRVEGSAVSASAFLEAYLPGNDLRTTTDPLQAQLRDRGQLRSYRIPDPVGPFDSGAVEVGPEPYRVIDATGHEHRRLFAVGIPLEGVLYGTALGPIAGTNSRFLRETDAIARAALTSAPRGHKRPALVGVSRRN